MQNYRENFSVDHPGEKTILSGKSVFGKDRCRHENLKRDIRKGLRLNFPEMVATLFDLTCNE